MIEEKTVFILGAGASNPYGYPTGIQLREQICTRFEEDFRRYYEHAEKNRSGFDRRLFIAYQEKEHEVIVDKFYKSSTTSIDLFLSRNQEFMFLGKMAIIFRILSAEQASRFRQMENRDQDWYLYLLKRLTDDLLNKEDYVRLCENNVSFITFNYDRSLEHFLYESLINTFNGIEKSKIVEQLNKIPIIHVFGQVAGLEWQDLKSKIEYRRDTMLISVERLVDDLRIIYEEEESPELKKAHDLIEEAEQIFFLGFGYAKENLGILKIPEKISIKQKKVGTALGFTRKEIESVKDIFRYLELKPSIYIEDMDCLTLLREYL